ncbi:S8 family serine peptidase [Agaribacterium haliotis]|uniref:S8 family serine peptidase n=1 Tax=Agaribacterium haliotis TaxID=2013869 RepID=UPI000BB54AD6|nr:S8 family serine peptidase [Agaribacterium haliotis]
MKKKLISAAISSITASGLFAFQQAHASPQSFEHSFEDIRQSVGFEQQQAASYFVRLDIEPFLVWQNRLNELGQSPNKKQQQQYRALLEDKLTAAMTMVENTGVKALDPVSVTDVGFTIQTTSENAQRLAKMPELKSVRPKQNFKRQRTYSTPWIGGERAHNDYGLRGKDQTIAIIDTGIDYLHADFLGSGNAADYENDDPTVIEAGSFPTASVIGGYDFAGFDYHAGEPENSVPKPDPDPIDDATHGTHVAGIAAGRKLGADMATGIAPEASLYALKVFGNRGSTNLVSQAIEKAMDPNGDGLPDDAVDVINLSLGSIFGSPEDASAVSAQNAVDGGVVVVASAGNSGNELPYISGSPGAADGVITVASSVSGGKPSFFIPFESEAGDSEVFAKYAGISPELSMNLAAPLEAASPFEACEAIANSFDGNIAVISRGSCAFTTKLENALAAGASAAVVINNQPGPAIVMGGSDVELPAAMIDLEAGQALLSTLAASSVSAEFSPYNNKADTSDDDTISSFSSRGPGPNGQFKPDISAPGDQVESALAGSGDQTLTISGTSMAAPQIAGVAALLREKFPGFGPREIKALMLNSARPAKVLGGTGSPPLSLQGTGIVDIEKALNASAYAYPGGIGFGLLKPEYNDAQTRWFEVTNFSDEDQRFDISVEKNTGAASRGISIDVQQQVHVGAGQTQRIAVTLRAQSSELAKEVAFQEFDGWIVLKSERSDIRVGFTSVVEPASKIELSRQQGFVKLHNTGFGDASVSTYTRADSDAANSFGYRSVSPLSVGFAVNVEQDWPNFSAYMLEMDIDVNEDGVVDYRARVADLDALDPASYDEPTGTIASAIDNLSVEPASRNLLYLANASTNNSVLQFQLDAYGDFGFLTGDDSNFNYSLRLVQRFADSGAVQLGSGSIELTEQVQPEAGDILVPAQQGATLNYLGKGEPMFVIETESSAIKRAK